MSLSSASPPVSLQSQGLSAVGGGLQSQHAQANTAPREEHVQQRPML